MEHQKEKHSVEAQTYDTLQYQIWLLLPGFCTGTTDVKQSFKVCSGKEGRAKTQQPMTLTSWASFELAYC